MTSRQVQAREVSRDEQLYNERFTRLSFDSPPRKRKVKSPKLASRHE